MVSEKNVFNFTGIIKFLSLTLQFLILKDTNVISTTINKDYFLS